MFFRELVASAGFRRGRGGIGLKVAARRVVSDRERSRAVAYRSETIARCGASHRRIVRQAASPVDGSFDGFCKVRPRAHRAHTYREVRFDPHRDSRDRTCSPANSGPISSLRGEFPAARVVAGWLVFAPVRSSCSQEVAVVRKWLEFAAHPRLFLPVWAPPAYARTNQNTISLRQPFPAQPTVRSFPPTTSGIPTSRRCQRQPIPRQ